MKTLLGIAILALATPLASGADESDAGMPGVIAKAEMRVDVLMRYSKSTEECFPDPDVKVRFEGGRVILGDFEKYKNWVPRLSGGLVAFKLNNKWGACDKDGKVVLPARFDAGFEFHEGLAGVSEGGKRGFIDKEGKWVIEPKLDLDYTWDFIGEVCPVSVGGKRAVIDKKGDFVWKPGLLRAEVLAGGVFIQTSDNREGFLDDSGKLIPDPKPNQRYYKAKAQPPRLVLECHMRIGCGGAGWSGYSDAETASGLLVTIPADKAIQAEIIRDTLESATDDDSTDKLVLKIERLLSAGVDVNVRDSSGNTPLLMSAKYIARPANVFKVLLDAGADVNARNENGDTALHMGSFLEKDLEAVRLLIDRGISVTAANKAGEAAFYDVAFALDDGPEAGEEPTARHIVAKLLLAAGADKCKDYMSRPVTVVPAPPLLVDPTVSKLADPTLRDDAFREVLSWQKYRSKPSAPDNIFKPLRHVVVCPQKQGPPIYAVFPSNRYEQRSAAKGHIMLIDADGAIIPYYHNANSIDDSSEFKDVNGDGVVDEVGTISFGTSAGSAEVLHVLPVTREQSPALSIVLKESDRHKAEWSWKLAETSEPGVCSIEIGPLDAKTNKLLPKARYTWSKEKSQYVGPAGGGKHPFMRMHAASPFGSAEFDAFVRKKDDQ